MNNALAHASFSDLAERVSALYNENEDALLLAMLGQEYVIRRSGITLRGQKAPETHETIIVDYLLSKGNVLIEMPWRAIGDITGKPAGEFRKRVEMPLAHYVTDFLTHANAILPLCDAVPVHSMLGSDLAINVRALPKVYLHVELSQETQEYPSEAWVMFSNNAGEFLSGPALQLLAELFKDRVLSLIRIY